VAGLVRFLAIEGEVKLRGARAWLDLDSLIKQTAIEPAFDPICHVDADEITD
jgi:hypothetical protein